MNTKQITKAMALGLLIVVANPVKANWFSENKGTIIGTVVAAGLGYAAYCWYWGKKVVSAGSVVHVLPEKTIDTTKPIQVSLTYKDIAYPTCKEWTLERNSKVAGAVSTIASWCEENSIFKIKKSKIVLKTQSGNIIYKNCMVDSEVIKNLSLSDVTDLIVEEATKPSVENLRQQTLLLDKKLVAEAQQKAQEREARQKNITQ